jgi:hypothetical protein
MDGRIYKRMGWARRAAIKMGRWWIAVPHPFRSGYIIRPMTIEEKYNFNLIQSLNKTMTRVIGQAILEEFNKPSPFLIRSM